MKEEKIMLFEEQMKKGDQGIKTMLQSKHEEVVRFMALAKGSFHLKMWDAKTDEILVEWEKPIVEGGPDNA